MTGGAFEVRNVHELGPFPQSLCLLKEDIRVNSPWFIGNWSNDAAPGQLSDKLQFVVVYDIDKLKLIGHRAHG